MEHKQTPNEMDKKALWIDSQRQILNSVVLVVKFSAAYIGQTFSCGLNYADLLQTDKEKR